MERATNIDNRLELFVDRLLISRMKGAELRLHEPRLLPLPLSPLPVAYSTVIKDGDRYMAWYRDYRPDYTGTYEDGGAGEITCYGESGDGHEWAFPDCGVTHDPSARGKNVVFAEAPFCHNFSPLLDTRPALDPAERFKALAGTHPGGLYAFSSPDGIRWRHMREKPVVTMDEFGFDSQNVSFWSPVERHYVCYFRTWETRHGWLRTISRMTSDDFIHWSAPVPMEPNLPGEHLYTSNTHPYFRAPHIYVALPTRFMPDRGESTDVLFMASRAGSTSYERLFTQSFIRPGLDPERWGNRSNYAALNVVPTGPAEISIYHKSGHRYVLRTDGFVSVRAGAKTGELVTKPLVFAGNALLVNVSTSAAGSLRVELQDAGGAPVPGFALKDCLHVAGDEIERSIAWAAGSDVGFVAGKPVRLRFVMSECDLYSFRFITR
jgi:hypothetical protein